ncbi:MAG: MOSC domain-containing protein [Chloroflexota bacterium]|nr:MOSC domain-containing protein [Chloroflexota bacterium]MDQ5865151.1 MOSC domain-containing protein [Chloroflexota bacterium]
MAMNATEQEAKKVLATGTVSAVCYSAELINGVGKEVRESAQVTKWGIPGDRHYGETRVSRGRVVPNNRPVTVVGADGTRAACEKLGIPNIPPGGLGENILAEGLGDLSDVTAGDEIHVLGERGEPKVILSVWKQNDPCANLMVYHKQMVKELMGRRGVLCTVLLEGEVRVGDTIAWVR